MSEPGPEVARLFVLRHGAVDDAWHGRIYGSLDVPLSAEGRDQARRAARRLRDVPLAAVVSSNLQRARFGADRLREGRALPEREDPELRELERGEWAGLLIDELRATRPGAWEAWTAAPAMVRPPGGESLEDLAARVLPRFAHWASAHAGSAIAVVAHGWVLRVLTCHALGLGLAHAPRLDVRTGDIAAFDWPLDPSTPPQLIGWALDRIPA
jgi:broad specificity phosphatase PhoE